MDSVQGRDGPSARSESNSVSVAMEVESAPEPEIIGVCDDCSSTFAARSPAMSHGDREVSDADPDVSSHNKENDGVERGGQAHRSRPPDVADITDKSPNIGFEGQHAGELSTQRCAARGAGEHSWAAE